MAFKLTKVIETTETVSLRDIPIKDWPEEARSYISPRVIEKAKGDLFPKDVIVVEVERTQKFLDDLNFWMNH